MVSNVISRSTDPRQVSKDLFNYFADNMRKQGILPPSAGVTEPLPDVGDAKSSVEALRNLASQHARSKGGGAFEGLNTPVELSYTNRRYEFISAEEGVRPFAYDDATGKTMRAGTPKQGFVTVGVGFNMDRPDARNVFQRVLGHGSDVFDKVYSGSKSLNPTEVRKLFDYTINEAEQIVANRFKDVDLTEPQRLALVSMAFNAPSLIGPKITAAIKSRDWKAAVNEVLYNSNRKKIKGLASRRWREAKLLSDVAALPDFSKYMSNFA